MSARKSTKYLVLHVTATKPSQDIGVKEVRAMHKAQGWSDVGYHYVIRRNGKVEAGRAEGDIGSHVKGFNSISLGISMVGGINAKGQPENNATPAQMTALEALLRDLGKKYPKATICGHRDLSPDRDKDGVIEPGEYLKACPCFDAIPWASSKGLPGADIKGTWQTTGTVETGDGPVSVGETLVIKMPDEVALELQTLLVKRGYMLGPIDGIIGDKTRKATKAFQAWAGLKVTGEFDKATKARLRAAN